MNARRKILDRVRAALRVEAEPPASPSSVPIWPVVVDPVERFRQEFIALRGEIITDLAGFLADFSRIASDVPDVVPGNADVRDALLGVTGCDCLVARTGSIAVCTRSAGGRSLSVLPPAHLVIARRDQIVPDLDSAVALWRKRYDGDWPSHLCLITGPSRTADIEKILVMGAHGPRRLAVFFTG